MIPDKNPHRRGFRTVFLIFGLTFVEKQITERLMTKETKRLAKRPNINAFMPKEGIRKFMKKRFMTEESILFMKIVFCLPMPLSMLVRVMFKYKNGHKGASLTIIAPKEAWL